MSPLVTTLFALHLFFTYALKAVDIANGIQQFTQRSKGPNPFSGAKGMTVTMHKVRKPHKH